jgi:hypothetical protein
MTRSASVDRLAVLALSLAVTSRALATPRSPDCSQLAHDQRVTGLEPGIWISDVAALTGFVFFAVDAKPTGVPAFLLLDVISAAGLVSFAAAGGGCIVRPDDELAGSSRTIPEFGTVQEARAARAAAIRAQSLVMGMNLVASGIMLLFVHKPASRVALGISTGFPLAYSLVNFKKFSPERDIDDSIPGRAARAKARWELFPEIDLAEREPAVGVGARVRF